MISKALGFIPLIPTLQIIEGITAGSLNFVSGLMVATLSKWPVATIPAGIFFGNTALVTILICATVTATGAHINSIVTISVAFSGLCSPVRAIVYLFCHLVGGSLGGAIVRASIGETLAHEIHNGGCWIEPGGAVSVWQAALIEFGCCFVLLSVTFLLLVRDDRAHKVVVISILGS